MSGADTPCPARRPRAPWHCDAPSQHSEAASDYTVSPNQVCDIIQRDLTYVLNTTNAKDLISRGWRNEFLPIDSMMSLLPGYQLTVKADRRTLVEMTGNILQSVGSMCDWRAKAYEETIFKDAEGINLFSAKVPKGTLDDLSVLAFKGIRLTSLKFLGPAAMISMYCDGSDALLSGKRGEEWMATAQWASVLGTLLTVLGSAAGYFSIAGTALLSAATLATIAAVLGLIGGVLLLAAVVGMAYLKKEEWVYWLSDGPLNKKRWGAQPIHESLAMTLQKLASSREPYNSSEAVGGSK